jgi:hypothetical protein
VSTRGAQPVLYVLDQAPQPLLNGKPVSSDSLLQAGDEVRWGQGEFLLIAR